MLDLVSHLAEEDIHYEVVVIDNGSTDRTGEILEDVRRTWPTLRVLHLPENEGYGGAILHGLRQTTGDVIGFTCADGEVGPRDLVALFRVMESGAVDLCKGKRLDRQDGPVRKLFSLGYHFLVAYILHLHTTDVNGYPVLFRREAFDRLGIRETNWIVNIDILFRARSANLRMAEVDVHHLRRAGGQSHVKWYFPILFGWQLISYKRSVARELDAV